MPLFLILRLVFNIILFFLVEWYFFQAIKTVFGHKPIVAQIYWSISILLVVISTFTLVTYPRYVIVSDAFSKYLLSIIFGIVLAKLLGCIILFMEDITRGMVFVVDGVRGLFNYSPTSYDSSRAKFVSTTALGIAGIPFFTALYGMIKTAFDYKIHNVRVYLPNLPDAFDGLKIVQISDIHSGSFVSKEPITKVVTLINNLQPDILFFTGDLVNNIHQEALPFIDTWKQLNTPALGIFSIVGNHDYGDYVPWDTPEEKEANFTSLQAIHGKMGWKILMNEGILLEKNGAKIGLLGVENWGEKLRFPKKGDITKAISCLKEEVPVKLLLSHDPSHWKAKVLEHADIDITFSGHTHGAQCGIEIPGWRWSPIQYFYDQWAGLYQQGNQYLYVNRGLGFLGYLGRIGIQPEITCMVLSNKK